MFSKRSAKLLAMRAGRVIRRMNALNTEWNINVTFL